MPSVWFLHNNGDSIGNKSITLRDFRFNSWYTDAKLFANGDLLLIGHGDSSLMVPRWQHLEDGYRPGFSAGFLHSYVLQNGQVLAHGYRGNSFPEFSGYVGTYPPPPAGSPATPTWWAQEGVLTKRLLVR